RYPWFTRWPIFCASQTNNPYFFRTSANAALRSLLPFGDFRAASYSESCVSASTAVAIHSTLLLLLLDFVFRQVGVGNTGLVSTTCVSG
ncbi:MAG TPA: hypothetical protein PLL06_03565, partial [Acidobacteriota bacterium]|nr:hypothetical protein [Acidobacteriota bacterium]